MRRIVFMMTCVAFAGLAGGCAAAGALAYKLSPAQSNPAEFKLPKEPTLVLVENYRNPDAVSVHAERLSRDITHQLTDHKSAPMIEPQKVIDLHANRGEEFHKLDIPAVARSVGAKQVVYVDLNEFSLEPPPGSEMYKGKAQAIVRVVDVSTGQTIWPKNSSVGREVKYETPFLRPTDGVDPNSVQEQMYQNLSERISRLFHDWQSDQPEGSEPDLNTAPQ